MLQKEKIRKLIQLNEEKRAEILKETEARRDHPGFFKSERSRP